MATRVVEGKEPYTGGKAISIDENKVISLNLRDENNLIIYDAGDDEIYVDLQLDDEITPTSAFPIGVNVGRVIVDNGWDKPGTIISAETTSGDNIKIFYADEGTLWIDNGTGTFKQIYFKADVDALLLALRNYIDGELAKKQNGVSSDTAPSNPSEGDLWYDTTNSAMKVWDGTAWQSVGTGGGGSDIVYATQAEYNALLPGALTDGKHYFIYTDDTPTPVPMWTYDFRGKTKAQVESDGWSLMAQANVDANGLYSTSWGNNLCTLPEIVDSSTKKITIIWGIYCPAGLALQMTNNSNTNNTGIIPTTPGDTYPEAIQFYVAGSSTEYSATIPTVADELICIIDLENLVMEASFASINTTYTQALTSSQVSGIQSNCKKFRIAFGSSNDRVQYVKFKVE